MRTDLNVSGNHLEDFGDVLHEPLVEHLVSLVDDEHLQEVGVEVFVLEHVNESPWRGDDDVHALAAALFGLGDGCSSDAAEGVDVEELPDSSHDVVDLFGEFSHGRQDDDLRLAKVGVDALQRADGKCAGLSGS